MAKKPRDLSFKVRIKQNRIPNLLGRLTGVQKRALEEIGEKAAEYANEHAPIDTGALSKSYDYFVKDNHLVVGSPLEYAPFVELGTGPNYKRPPQWVINLATKGHHAVDPWWYMGDDGEWHQGWFIRAQPHLRPAFTEQKEEFKAILKHRLKNA